MLEVANNVVELTGVLMGRPEISHMGKDSVYYTFPLGIERLSGTQDVINVILRREMLQELSPDGEGKVAVSGELRSFNNKTGVGNRLVISVFAHRIGLVDTPDRNDVELRGTICKEPNFRRTPMGRQICDMMLAVNRRYGRADYIPCIVWGQLAEMAAQWGVGTAVQLAGRIQSRKYIKIDGERQLEKTAYEVSAVRITRELDVPEEN